MTHAVPFMGSAEIRDGPFSLLGDVLHVGVGTNLTTRNIFFNGGSAALTANIGTAVLLYHALDTMRSTPCVRPAGAFDQRAALAFATGACRPS